MGTSGQAQRSHLIGHTAYPINFYMTKHVQYLDTFKFVYSKLCLLTNKSYFLTCWACCQGADWMDCWTIACWTIAACAFENEGWTWGCSWGCTSLLWAMKKKNKIIQSEKKFVITCKKYYYKLYMWYLKSENHTRTWITHKYTWNTNKDYI